MKQNCLRCNNCIHENVCHFWIYESYPSSFYDSCTAYEENKIGKWEWVQYDANPKIGNWHCSNCNYINKSDSVTDFCPSCGADLRGE